MLYPSISIFCPTVFLRLHSTRQFGGKYHFVFFVHLTYFSTLAPSCFPITQAYLFYWVKRSKNTFWLLEKCWIYSITVRTHNLLAHFTQHQHTCENKCIILTCTVDTQVLKRLFLECYRYGSLSFFPKYYLNWVVVFRMALGYFFFSNAAPVCLPRIWVLR